MEVFDEMQRVVVIRNWALGKGAVCSLIAGCAVLVVWFPIGAVGQDFVAFGRVVALAVCQEVPDVEVADMEALEGFVDEGAHDGARGILDCALGLGDGARDLLLSFVDGISDVVLDPVNGGFGILSEAGQGAPKVTTDGIEVLFGARKGGVDVGAGKQAAEVE